MNSRLDPLAVPLTLLMALCGSGGLCGCGGGDQPETAASTAGAAATPVRPGPPLDPFAASPDQPATAGDTAPDPYIGFPLHGLITGTQLTILREPDPESILLGWLRRGDLIRLKAEPIKTSTCSSGWYPVHPKGFACAGLGIQVQDKPFVVAPELSAQSNRDQALPYSYYFVKDFKVPEYHQLPSRDQQRTAAVYGARWQELSTDEKKKRTLKRFLAGELKNEPRSHAAVRRYLDRGFYVAGTGVEVRSRRRFVRTVRGSYVKESHLIKRAGPVFHGVELDDERGLPIAWAIRTSHPLKAISKADGTTKWKKSEEHEPYARLTQLTEWKERKRVGAQIMHLFEDGTYLRDWFVAVAKPMDRPKGIRDIEPWVHVDLSDQTLVLYRGAKPIYATLIASGLEGHDTPVGEFHIQRKHVSATMSDIGADSADDRYSIDDVPWTQYFQGSLALHGAFWHERFGMRRSHGCVNLSPPDARHIFDRTWPTVPEGWHGASVHKTGFSTTRVFITE